jgi:hypothetical protein
MQIKIKIVKNKISKLIMKKSELILIEIMILLLDMMILVQMEIHVLKIIEGNTLFLNLQLDK